MCDTGQSRSSSGVASVSSLSESRKHHFKRHFILPSFDNEEPNHDMGLNSTTNTDYVFLYGIRMGSTKTKIGHDDIQHFRWPHSQEGSTGENYNASWVAVSWIWETHRKWSYVSFSPLFSFGFIQFYFKIYVKNSSDCSFVFLLLSRILFQRFHVPHPHV